MREGEKDQEIIDYMQQQADNIGRLQEELDERKQKLEDHSNDTELLKKLYERVYIDINGNPTHKYNKIN